MTWANKDEPRTFSQRLIAAVRRFRALSQGEGEMALNRIVISSLILAYFLIFFDYHEVERPLLQVGLFFACTIGLAAHLMWRPARHHPRRAIAILCDLGVLTIGLYDGGETTAVLFPIYLWVIFGNGFRFGSRYLVLAAAFSIIGFAAVLTTPFWMSHVSLSIGLLISLVILPLYASKLIRDLSAAKAKAEEASRAKSLFLAGVSHELRTPLNAIIGMGELLQESDLDTEQRDMTRTIKSSARSLLSLIDGILEFSRIESNSVTVSEDPFDLHAMLGEVRSIVAGQARSKGLRFSIHVTPETPYALVGDTRHLQEILINLTGNAVKFTNSGGVTISVGVVRSNSGSARLRFEVEDTGIGIRPDAQARIFERFTQADETIIDRFGGTGLGLAIVKQLVLALGGEIGVTSEENVGSIFWFEIDFARDLDASAPQLTLDSGRLIVLSKNPVMLDQVMAHLMEQDIKVERAADVREVATHLRKTSLSGSRRAVVFVDQDVAAGKPDVLAHALQNPGQTIIPTLVLLSRNAEDLEDSSEIRRLYSAVLSPDAETDHYIAALRAAGATDLAVERDEERLSTFVPSGRSLRVLVAEDNRTNQRVIAKILERGGHECHIVDDGEQALDALADGGFDIAIMDVNMPVMNGLDAMKLYRFSTTGDQKRLPIVALTADATPEAAKRCMEAGADACVTKPIEPARLLKILDTVHGAGAAGNTAQETVRQVTHIASHPRFKAEARSTAVDMETLAELERLGGTEFVASLVGDFLTDATDILNELTHAVENADTARFREHAHALRSAAANIGAREIFKLCSSWQSIGGREMLTHGQRHIDTLSLELDRARSALSGYVSRQAANGASSGRNEEGGHGH
ncbi:response regulator [Stappia sp. F7233]|uniref:Sensory/regulatory protein RpfC n=1 Tax=Stappia albiluteola TaxID=2758565 RepID=A0A839AEB9_9HYPH|nr:hybrid sensor histidine kinase/response regulator [Stappia albiluteola]MBA5777157.1 response regulator [Stappia albiluteola]